MLTRLMIGIVVLAASLAAAQPGNTGNVTEIAAMPEGKAGERVREVIALINAGDPARVREFAASAMTGYAAKTTPEDYAAEFLNVRGKTGGIEFRCDRVFEHEGLPDQTLAIVRASSTGLYWHIDIGVKPDTGQVSHLFFGVTRPPAAEAEPRPSEAELPAAMEKFADRLGAAGAFSGSVLLARDGEVLFAKAYGIANRDHDIPNRTDTKFNLASMNKMFTAVAVGQLVERGRIAWDDPVGVHLASAWVTQETAAAVRIEHLLTHTAGMGDYFERLFPDAGRFQVRELKDYKRFVADRAPAFEPGSKWSYSNTGFLLLGAVIESASEQNYFDYVRDHIYRRAGMADTDCYELDKPVKNLAIGYSVEYGPPPAPPVYRSNIFRHVLRGSPAGGGFSTVEDLLKFDAALRSGKLIKPQTLELLTTPRPDLHEPDDYAMGFMVRRVDGGRVVGHGGGGGDMGISSSLLIFLDSGYTVAALSNSSDGADIIEARALEWVPGRR